MKSSLRLLCFCLFISSLGYVPSIGTATAASKGGVSKNMVTLAKALYASSQGGFGDNKYIFDKVEVVEVGKNLGRGIPVKFKIKGIHGYKTQSSPPPGWNTNGFPIWVGDTIEAEMPFSDIYVVFFTKNEFGKAVACSDGGFQCINEENMKQHLSMLENMKIQHAIAKRQDAQRQTEYAQRQRDEDAQRTEQARLNQLRAEASIPSVTLGTYKCVNRYFSSFENKVADGDLILTDVDVSYIHIFPNEAPFRTKVVFSFDNITNATNQRGYIAFDLKREIWIRDGDRVFGIEFTDEATASKFFHELNNARLAWNIKHPEL